MTTKIQWTEDTWNPIAGCSVISPGCTNCYAMRRQAPRLAGNPATPHYHGTVQPSKAGYVWTGKIGIAGDTAFLKPVRTKKPTMFFVNSMSDLFHENVPDEVIDRIFAIMALCPQHTFQILTKRSARMREYVSDERAPYRVARVIVDMAIADKALMKRMVQEIGDSDEENVWPVIGEGDPEWPDDITLRHWPMRNVWLGVSVEDQTRADERIPDLLATPAAIRFISAEPLLGALDILPYLFIYTHDDDRLLGTAPASELPELPFHDPASTPASDIATPRLDWVIVGGESGKGARPMHPEWARQIRDQCADVGVPFFFKQWGEWAPNIGAVDGWDLGDDPEISRFDHREWEDGRWVDTFRPMWCDFSDGNYDEAHCVSRIGTKRAGRLLDGVEHNALPEPVR